MRERIKKRLQMAFPQCHFCWVISPHSRWLACGAVVTHEGQRPLSSRGVHLAGTIVTTAKGGRAGGRGGERGREGGRERASEGGRLGEGGRERASEGGKEGGRAGERGREGGREAMRGRPLGTRKGGREATRDG